MPTRRMKRSTRRRLLRGVLYAVLVAALAAVVLAADWEAVAENFFDAAILAGTWPTIVTVAAKNTVLYTVVAFVGGLVVGLLLVIFAFAFAVPIAFDWQPPGGPAVPALTGLVVVSAAYIAETLRAGIQAVPKGQVEAAKSLGMNPLWSTVSIVLPQALRIVIPPLTNELVIIIKDTSLLPRGRRRRGAQPDRHGVPAVQPVPAPVGAAQPHHRPAAGEDWSATCSR